MRNPARETTDITAQSVRYLGHSLEVLWLLTAAAVPLIFVPQDYMLSEAVNAYVEIPKTTVFRTLVGIMAILWMAEWVLKGGLQRRYSIAHYLTRLNNWLGEQPTRWVVVGACFYVVVAIVTTALSTAFWTSVWGEVPGQFGYSAYTLVSYFVLFAVIATHLKTREQLWRLLGVIVATGALVALYGMVQHYGLDPLNLGETGSSRVTSTMANPVFTGAAMVMTTMMTIGVGLLVLDRMGWNVIRVALWVMLIAAQLMVTFWTGSRGAFLLGLPAGLLAFLALLALANTRDAMATNRTGLVGVFGIIVLLGVLVLIGQLLLLDQIDLPGIPILVVVLVAFGVLAVLSIRRLLLPDRLEFLGGSFAKAYMVMGLGLLVALAVVALTPSPSDVSLRDADIATGGVGQVEGRLSSITSTAERGGVSFRTDIWDSSMGLIINRPWFEYEPLSLSYLRPLVGYGPEMFKYTFPLESPLGGLLSQAHNFFLHHWVEQGVLGLFSSVGLFVPLFLVGLITLWRNRDTYSTSHKWVLITVIATLAGRVVEMLVGVARESDLVTVWILLAIFVVLPSVMNPAPKVETATPAPQDPPPRPTTRRERRAEGRRSREARSGPALPAGTFRATGMVVVAAVVVFIGWLTWDKNVDYAWAAVLAAEARDSFDGGDLTESSRLMSQASSKAPNVPNYHHNLAGIYGAYRRFAVANPDRQLRSCEDVFEFAPREDPVGGAELFTRCVEEAYLANVEAFKKNPNSPQVKLELANSTLPLALLNYEGRAAEAIRYFEELPLMLPSSWQLRNFLASAYLRLGLLQESLAPLQSSLALTGETSEATQALLLQGIAHRQMEHLPEAIESFQRGLALAGDSADSNELRVRLIDAHNTLANFHIEQGQFGQALEALEKSLAVDQTPAESATALYLQGQAYQELDEPQRAIDSFEQSLVADEAGPLAANVHLQLAEVYRSLGDEERASEHERLAEELQQG